MGTPSQTKPNQNEKLVRLSLKNLSGFQKEYCVLFVVKNNKIIFYKFYRPFHKLNEMFYCKFERRNTSDTEGVK